MELICIPKTIMINNEPDLITLLMAVSFLHMYRSFSKEDLELLIAVDSYRDSLMMVPYEDENYKPEMTRDLQHVFRILDAHRLAYKELLSQC